MLIRYADYLVITKSDLDNYLNIRLLEKADDYTLPPSAK